MATYTDFGTPTDTLASPSLSEWAAAVAAELDAIAAMNVGGTLQVSGSIPSSTTGNTAPATVATSTVWGGVAVAGSGLTVPTAGLYRISATGMFTTNGTGTIRLLWVVSSGSVAPAGQHSIGQYAPPSAATTGPGAALSASGVWPLTAGQAVWVLMRQDSGASQTGSVTLSVQLIH